MTRTTLAQSFLRQLIAVDSCNPPGHEAGIAQLIVRMAAELDLPTPALRGRAAGRTNVIIETGTGEPSLMLLAHLDTVPPGDPATWTSDPYKLTAHADRYTGLGVADMKGAIVAILLGAAGFRGPGRLVLVFTADEEGDGGHGMQWLLDEVGVDADAAVVLEPASVTEHSWDGVYVAGRGSCVVSITAHGTPGHTALAEPVESRAGHRLVTALHALMTSDLFPDQRHPVDGSPPLVNPTSLLQGGVTPWQHPDVMQAKVEVRTVLGMTPESVKAAFERELTHRNVPDVEVELADWGAASDVTADPRLVGAALTSMTAVLGRVPPLGVYPAFTDGIATSAAGIPTIHAFGPGSLRVAHRPDEWILASDLHKSIDLVEQLVRAYFSAAA